MIRCLSRREAAVRTSARTGLCHARLLLGLASFAICVEAQSGSWHASADNSFGWQLMSPAERGEHQRMMRTFTDYAQCVAYQDAHHLRMTERARSLGVILSPRERSGCDQLKARGRLK